jgi:adenylate kinase
MIIPRRRLLVGFLVASAIGAQSPPKRVILMLGPPGAGKTTQSEKLKSAMGLPIISMTEVLRREGGGKGGLNKNLRSQIASGDLLSDEMANSMMRKRITQKDCERGFIVDGYPFTAKQAEYFEALLADLSLPRPIVVHLSVPDNEAYQRLQKRGRVDDTPGNVERRIVEYRREAELLLARYPNAITVDAMKSPGAVADEIRKGLGF